MNAFRVEAAVAAAAVLPLHVLVIAAVCAGVIVLLVYAGIALPAVWSTRPARRRAAAEVLCQILTFSRSRQP